MEGHVQAGAYKDVVLFLATAGVVVPLFRQWKISPILGFLGAGVVAVRRLRTPARSER